MQISESVRSMVNPDGGVLLDIERGVILSLNVAGSKVWTKLQQNLSVNQIVEEISAEFDIPCETAWQDVKEFMHSLQDHTLLKVDGQELP
jgi:hypothetical protein